LLTPDGTCLLLKGAKADDELAKARRDWSMEVDKVPSRTGSDGTILRITGLKQVRHPMPN
jgi:16S rRNA (guanine527-N7)-methyltransferase